MIHSHPIVASLASYFLSRRTREMDIFHRSLPTILSIQAANPQGNIGHPGR
jgi:hypothetical protein